MVMSFLVRNQSGAERQLLTLLRRVKMKSLQHLMKRSESIYKKLIRIINNIVPEINTRLLRSFSLTKPTEIILDILGLISIPIIAISFLILGS